VANVIWSWGKLGHFPTAPAWQAVSAVITSDGGSLLYSPAATPQALSNLAWGLCQIRCKEEGVWDVVQKAVKAALASARSSHQAGAPAGPAFAALDIASTAWSLATVGRYNLLLFHDLCTTAMVRKQESLLGFVMPPDLSTRAGLVASKVCWLTVPGSCPYVCVCV
jgi:hypothetical protein